MQEVHSPLKEPYSTRDLHLAKYSRPCEQPYHARQTSAFRNVACVEIKELKDSLAYAEYLLAKSI
jgi:hypothetical protein